MVRSQEEDVRSNGRTLQETEARRQCFYYYGNRRLCQTRIAGRVVKRGSAAAISQGDVITMQYT